MKSRDIKEENQNYKNTKLEISKQKRRDLYGVMKTQEVKVRQRRGKLWKEEGEGRKKSLERWKCKAETEKRKKGK
ncbi:hypothetical protein E2C01_071042 [Portunus trituberculatus]|uniref:Uncharacterized protein n=1 Tax=Portunus trituberculatus TaxID=210409 RepID=A0A5B7I399_PORTR|nr:hypothetical protein [Portunus trituberculatus]